MSEAMAGEDGDCTPAFLIDFIEKELQDICAGCTEAEGVAESLLLMIVPDLRITLNRAGADVPIYGPSSHQMSRKHLMATERNAAMEAKDARETALYRWWDADDILLYAGIADHIGNRTKDHAKGSSWMDFAVRSAVERHPRRSLALAAEEAAIKAEHPIFNKQHNDTPEARRRQVEYLIAHDRLDLLAPAVSRA